MLVLFARQVQVTASIRHFDVVFALIWLLGRHGDKCNWLHPEGLQGSEKPVSKKQKRDKQGKGGKQVEPKKTSGQLLKRLLAKEIYEEKSLILQCFRFIVDNAFFGASTADK